MLQRQAFISQQESYTEATDSDTQRSVEAAVVHHTVKYNDWKIYRFYTVGNAVGIKLS